MVSFNFSWEFCKLKYQAIQFKVPGEPGAAKRSKPNYYKFTVVEFQGNLILTEEIEDNQIRSDLVKTEDETSRSETRYYFGLATYHRSS